MNENIDLTKILKDCPKGTKLYSSVFGDVELVKVSKNENVIFPIEVKRSDKTPTYFTKDGKLYVGYSGECVLFPSKEQRDWSKFTAPWYKKEMDINNMSNKDDERLRKIAVAFLKDFAEQGYENAVECIDWLKKQGEDVSSQPNERAWLYLVSDMLTWKDGIGQYLDDPRVQELAKILCSKYTQKLYNPSILSNSSNTGKNEQKFDPKTLKPFDKILARNGHSGNWNCDIFSHINDGDEPYKYSTISNYWEYCIPYNDETKHLVGTNKEAPEYYRY